MQQSKMDFSDSQKVALQGRAVLTNAHKYLLKTTPLSGCAGVALRGQKVAILLHGDTTTTKNDIENAVSKAREKDMGDLRVQVICRDDQKTHWNSLTQDIPGVRNVRRVATYSVGERVIVCMDSGKPDIHKLPNDPKFRPLLDPFYIRLNEIKAWSILYNVLQFDQTPLKFGNLFLEKIEDVTSAKGEAVNAFRGLKIELVTTNDCVDSKELESYIRNTISPAANLETFIKAVVDLSESKRILKRLRGLNLTPGCDIAKGTLAEFYEKSEDIQTVLNSYIETSLDFAKEINDIVTSPEYGNRVEAEF